MSDSPRALRILAGSGRSGTTWLQDVLCVANDLRAIFEPLEPHGWERAKAFSRKYANANTVWPELEAFWGDVNLGQAPGIWSDYRVRPDRLVPRPSSFSSLTAFKQYLAHWLALKNNSRKFREQKKFSNSIIKVIRANLMLSWLADQPHSKIAFVIRHPAAVVESQLRLGNDWNAKRIAAFYNNDIRLNERLGIDWAVLCSKTQNDAELFTLIWCLENVLPLQECGTHERVAFICFEHLATGDHNAWERLLSAFDLNVMPDARLIAKPSQQASANMDQAESKAQYLASSLGRLSDENRTSIQTILDRVGVEFYNTTSMEPQWSKVESVYNQDWSLM
ncbi:MAG: hypothetical protein AB8G18_15770 [Gammaproteobacteria bacterium]